MHLLYIEFFFWKNIKFSIFGGISKILKLIVFGQISSKLGRFGYFWVEIATLAIDESMPEARLKSLKPFNSSTVNPKATWSGSLISYHPYLLPQKVSKNPKTYCIHSSLPKNARSRSDFHRILHLIAYPLVAPNRS
jgi:hypothetical protein